MTTRIHLTILFAVSAAGCVGEIGSSSPDDPTEEGSNDEPVVCMAARSYTGFGGPLEVGRPEIEPGSDRLRIKPFNALSEEYKRSLGLASFDTAPYAATFGRPPARWFNEPQASANTIYAAFALAYGACTVKTSTGTDFAEAPSAASADRHCKDFTRAAWQREASADEIAVCTAYALNKTKPTDAPAKRWAYTCAAVLTASDFLAY
jgi:hypothetical protein